MKLGPARPGSGDLKRKQGVPFLICCPAGGLDPRKSCFFINLIISGQQNTSIWSVLSLKSMLERLVLKKYVECTSQRLKWRSGARDMTIFGYARVYVYTRVYVYAHI